MDAFAVAVAAGGVLPGLSFRAVFRLSWHFAFFQFLMPVLGWFAGRGAMTWVADYGCWIAVVLLAFVGTKMLYESFRHKPHALRSDPTRGWSLVVLSVATSIDAFAVGLTMALLGTRVWFPSVIIGVVAGLLTITGVYLGRRLGKHLGHRMELLGGLILIGIGIKILVEHAF